MSDDIIVALIGFAAVVVAQIIISKASAKDLYAKLDKQSELSDAKMHEEIAVIKQDVTSLREETRKHNGMIERTYSLERRASVADEQIAVLNREMKEVKQKIG